MSDPRDWLEVTRGEAPLVVSMPHTGTVIHADIEERLASPWLARKDADWHVERLYDFAAGLGATVVRTRVSRTVIDVNRSPYYESLYPGHATTELCPTTTFDGEPLYRAGPEPRPEEVIVRRALYFDPYHAALSAELARLKGRHGRVVLYDCHSIRSVIPRLFAGELPHLNVGTNDGRSCDPALTAAVEAVCDASPFTRVTNGRFKGGYITRHHGRPAEGVHAIQMELAMRGYLREPVGAVSERDWPPEYDEALAAPMRDVLRHVLEACLAFAL
jgi:N-formylglutamate deformylase